MVTILPTPATTGRRPLVSRFDPRALYWQAADLLRERITSGQYPPGQNLPPEPTLRAELGVSRAVLRHAIALLRTEGLISYRPGYRNQVLAQPRRRHLRPPADAVVITRMPTPHERIRLKLPDGVPVLDVDGQVYPGDRYALRVP